LKRRQPGQKRRNIRDFRGEFAAASLKRFDLNSDELAPEKFPRRIRRGLIEATLNVST